MSLTTVMTRCLIDFWKIHHDFLPVWHCPPRRSHDEISETGPSRAKVVYANVILVSYYEIYSNESNRPTNSIITG